jgi:hypothetical protein
LSYKAVQQNDTIAAAWLCWEAKAFSADSTDRFSVNNKRTGGSAITTGDYPSPDTSAAYIAAMQAGQTVISEPYRQNGGYIVSVASPIKYRTQSLGVCGVDVSTETLSSVLHEAVKDNPLFQSGGSAYLISPEGKIVASSDPKANIGASRVRFDGKTETSLESAFTLQGKTWQVQLIVPKSAVEGQITAFQSDLEAKKKFSGTTAPILKATSRNYNAVL